MAGFRRVGCGRFRASLGIQRGEIVGRDRHDGEVIRLARRARSALRVLRGGRAGSGFAVILGGHKAP
jgi:hypothetical protein